MIRPMTTRLEQADTLIWLQLPFRTIFWRIFIRSIQRARDKKKICGDNVETWRHTYLSRDSLLLFHIKRRLFGYRASRERREALIREHGAGAGNHGGADDDPDGHRRETDAVGDRVP